MRIALFNALNRISYALRSVGVDRIPFAIPLYRKIAGIVRPEGLVKVSVKGGILFVDPKDRVLAPRLLAYGDGGFESEVFSRAVKQGMVVADVGAHIGYYTLLAARNAGKEGKVYAFEPEPGNFSLLVKNIQENHYMNAFPIQKAVSSKKGKLKLFVDGENFAGHSISKGNVPGNKKSIEVKVISLDSFFEGKRIDFIKMDVQGAEGLILDGAKKTLKKTRAMIMEFWPYGLIQMGSDPLVLLEKMRRQGFDVQMIDEKQKKLREFSKEQASRLCENPPIGEFVNLFFEKKSQVLDRS